MQRRQLKIKNKTIYNYKKTHWMKPCLQKKIKKRKLSTCGVCLQWKISLLAPFWWNTKEKLWQKNKEICVVLIMIKTDFHTFLIWMTHYRQKIARMLSPELILMNSSLYVLTAYSMATKRDSLIIAVIQMCNHLT